MVVRVNGAGSITGLEAGGLPDSSITTAEIADAAVTAAKLSTGAPSWTSGGVLSFNSGYGSVATAYGVRAWVNFDGTGTVAIRGSGNVSSITDNGACDYTLNFTAAMPDANYGTNVTMAHSNTNSGPGGNYFGNGPTPVVYQATGLVRVAGFDGSNTGTYYDSPNVSVAIFR